MNARATEFVKRFLVSRVCGAALLETQAQQLTMTGGTPEEREDNELRAAALIEKAGWLREAAEKIGHEKAQECTAPIAQPESSAEGGA